MSDIVIKRVSRGKSQNRVTLPKKWKGEYVALQKIKSPELKIIEAIKRGKYDLK